MPVKHHARPGYIFLLTVLVVGVIATATATSLLLLGWAAEQNGLLLMETAQAYEHANTCAERALRELRINSSYAGSQTFALPRGSCEIRAVGGAGNNNRTLCTAGYSGDNSRRLEIEIDALYPKVIIKNWKEVSGFTLCP
jgi:hypothetical protein